jgi:hypothetical protein
VTISAPSPPSSHHSKWVCGDPNCRSKLATVRGFHPGRRLICTGAARTVHREDGIVEMTCAVCGKVNRFVWRAPSQELIAS